jgi:hypothetical protein
MRHQGDARSPDPLQRSHLTTDALRRALRRPKSHIDLRRLAAAGVLVVVAILVWKLSGSSSSDVTLLAGEHKGDLNSGSIPIKVGAVGDFSALIKNPSNSSVQLLSASLISMPKQQLPRLVGVAIATSPSYDEPGRGWPNLDVPHRPFPGVLNPGQTWLIWGATGNQVGADYSALGLRVTYRAGGQDHEVSVWGPGAVCVRPPTQHTSDRRCEQDGSLALKAAETQSG